MPSPPGRGPRIRSRAPFPSPAPSRMSSRSRSLLTTPARACRAAAEARLSAERTALALAVSELATTACATVAEAASFDPREDESLICEVSATAAVLMTPGGACPPIARSALRTRPVARQPALRSGADPLLLSRQRRAHSHASGLTSVPVGSRLASSRSAARLALQSQGHGRLSIERHRISDGGP
jgi:hypothetical protein